MAQGIPVVTTKIGIEGIENVQGETALVGDSAQRLAEFINSLFMDAKKAERIGKSGYETMSECYSWNSIVARLERIYSNVVIEKY